MNLETEKIQTMGGWESRLSTPFDFVQRMCNARKTNLRVCVYHYYSAAESWMNEQLWKGKGKELKRVFTRDPVEAANLTKEIENYLVMSNTY